MKKLFTLIALSFPFFSFAQHYTATFEDGKKIDYDIISDKFKDSKPLNILFGETLLSYGIFFEGLGASYHVPDKFVAEASFGLLPTGAIHAEGIYFLKSWDSPKNMKFSVKSEYVGNNTIKKYIVKYELQRRAHIGPHIGFSTTNHGGGGTNAQSSSELSVGFGFFRGRFLNILLSGEDQKPVKMRGTSQFGAYADIVIYMLNYASDYTGDKLSSTGIRMYIKGKGSLWGKRDFGFTYMLGFGSYGTQAYYPVLGFGVYGGF